MHSLRQIGRKLRAWIAALLKPRSDTTPGLYALEREVTAVTRETRLLAAELQRIRDDPEELAPAENRILAILDEARQEARSALDGEVKRHADLERRVVELVADGHQSLVRIKSIETTLVDVLSHLDMIDNQAREYRARHREQEKAFEASLSLAISRQNATDTRLEELQHATSLQVTGLESSLADSRTRLEAMGGQVGTLEQKLELEHRLYLHTVQEIQSQVRNQDHRLGWTMMAAVFAMLLGAAAGGILIWDVQKNARILAGMSRDIDRLRSVFGQPLATQTPAAAVKPASAPDVTTKAGISETRVPREPEISRPASRQPTTRELLHAGQSP